MSLGLRFVIYLLVMDSWWLNLTLDFKYTESFYLTVFTYRVYVRAYVQPESQVCLPPSQILSVDRARQK